MDSDLRANKYRKLDPNRIIELDTGIVYVACPAATPWTRERVERFNAMLCRLMIVCNIAWWAVENPYWRLFFDEWLPEVPMPGRRELSGQILDREAAKCVDEMKLHVGNRFATGQCDGWKDIVKSSVVATMLNVEYTPWLVNTSDISRSPKNAENLLKLVLEELRYATEQLKVVVVAWCTDCSGESAKMRRLLAAKFKRMVSLDCWAHQVSLATESES
ncbi:hypothetical protein AURDEDRAFT_76253 [Auricularia subglabra TFB-10046 SS5]|nr:hypothetical protein AURDEDRAFT_76253 [Auricularia subglabra TFB-10046 SS5]